MAVERFPSYKYILILFLFELGFALKFNFIGVISISELFLLFYVPTVILPKVCWKSSKDLRNITIAYIILLLFQVLSEYMIGNELTNSLKGVAITVVSYFHFIFLIYYLSRWKKLILILLLSQIFMRLFSEVAVEEQTIEDVIHGEAAAYLKFYISPIVILIFLCLSVMLTTKKFPLLFSFLGVILVVLGARSSGGMAFVAGLVTYMISHRLVVRNKKRFIISLAVLCVIAYSCYAYYVNQVLSGAITSGNNRQLFLCENPYNPLELLIAGRSEMWVGWQAFMDKFWFGHGAWPYDSTGKYQRMMYAMHDELSKFTLNTHYLIPSHSVLVGSGMMNGVFAFVTMAYILYFFIKRGVLSFIHCERKYKLVLVYYVFDLLWTAFFSPQSHFRLSMPIAFAIIFVIHASIRTNVEHKNTVQPAQADGGCSVG